MARAVGVIKRGSLGSHCGLLGTDPLSVDISVNAHQDSEHRPAMAPQEQVMGGSGGGL